MIFLVNRDDGQLIANAVIVNIKETLLGNLTTQEIKEGNVVSEEMYGVFRTYYAQPVTIGSPLKIIQFKLQP